MSQAYVSVLLAYYVILVLTRGKDYIVQGARYQIVEELGCNGTEDYSGVSVLLVDSWTITLPTISLVYYTRMQFHFRQ